MDIDGRHHLYYWVEFRAHHSLDNCNIIHCGILEDHDFDNNRHSALWDIRGS